MIIYRIPTALWENELFCVAVHNSVNCQLISESLLLVNLHKMHSIMADLRQNQTGKKDL